MELKKIMIFAYDINPLLGSEAGVAYKWVKIISKYYYVELVTDSKHKNALLKCPLENVNYNFIELKGILCRILRKLKLYNVLNLIFISKTKNDILKRKLSIDKIKLIHCLNPAGIHSFNDLYKLGIPVVIGPLGGALLLPDGFKRYQSIKNILRDAYYNYIKLFSSWRNYYVNSKKVIIGTQHLSQQLPLECIHKTTVLFDTTVDTEIFYPKIRDNSNKIVILYCGRLELEKGCMLLLEAFKNLRNKGYFNIRLDMLGSGKRYSEIERFIKKNSLDECVNCIGAVSHDKIPEYMQNSHIFCLPTLREPGGTVILEAMSCELPIVTTNYGGPAFSVNKDCGIKIEPKSFDTFIEDLTSALEYLINNEDVRLAMGEKGRRRIIEEFSVKALENKIKNLYNDVVG
ncbi:MAG: glycosyltransferase family 4 protein [Bacillota bacterium]|nr:glycosyltransferase family 4 protein [Bacillota bacterium]